MFRRVAIAVGVLILGLLGYGIKLIVFPSPEATVQRYFEALRARNLSAVAEELTDHLSLNNEANWASMWLALNDRHFEPPQGIRMGGWQSAPTAEGERLVAVQFDLGGTTYSSLLRLRMVAGAWRIANGMGTIEVNVSTALVNGQSVGATKRIKLPPGRYEMMVNPSAPLLTAAPVSVVVTPDRVGTVRLDTTLASDAAGSVKRYLDVIITACETTMGVERNDCPFKSVDTSGMKQVQWKLVSMPELVVEQTGPESVAVRSLGQGAVRLHALTAAGVGVDRVESFSINGKCGDKDAMVGCTFSS